MSNNVDIWSITGNNTNMTNNNTSNITIGGSSSQESQSWPTHNGHISVDSFLITIDRFHDNNNNNKPPLYSESKFHVCFFFTFSFLLCLNLILFNFVFVFFCLQKSICRVTTKPYVIMSSTTTLVTKSFLVAIVQWQRQRLSLPMSFVTMASIP